MFKKLRQDHQKFKFSFTIHKLQDLDGQRDIPPLSVEWARGKKRNGSTAIATAPPSSRHGVEILWNETFETKGTMFFSKQKKSSKENNSSPKFLKKSLEFKILEHPNESSTNNKKKNKPKIIGTSEVDLAGFCDIKESMEKVVSIPIAKLRDHPSATLLVTIKSWLRSEDDEGSTISAMTSEGELSEIDNDETEFSQEKDSINNNNNDDNNTEEIFDGSIPIQKSEDDLEDDQSFSEQISQTDNSFSQIDLNSEDKKKSSFGISTISKTGKSISANYYKSRATKLENKLQKTREDNKSLEQKVKSLEKTIRGLEKHIDAEETDSSQNNNNNNNAVATSTRSSSSSSKKNKVDVTRLIQENEELRDASEQLQYMEKEVMEMEEHLMTAQEVNKEEKERATAAEERCRAMEERWRNTNEQFEGLKVENEENQSLVTELRSTESEFKLQTRDRYEEQLLLYAIIAADPFYSHQFPVSAKILYEAIRHENAIPDQDHFPMNEMNTVLLKNILTCLYFVTHRQSTTHDSLLYWMLTCCWLIRLLRLHHPSHVSAAMSRLQDAETKEDGGAVLHGSTSYSSFNNNENNNSNNGNNNLNNNNFNNNFNNNDSHSENCTLSSEYPSLTLPLLMTRSHSPSSRHGHNNNHSGGEEGPVRTVESTVKEFVSRVHGFAVSSYIRVLSDFVQKLDQRLERAVFEISQKSIMSIKNPEGTEDMEYVLRLMDQYMALLLRHHMSATVVLHFFSAAMTHIDGVVFNKLLSQPRLEPQDCINVKMNLSYIENWLEESQLSVAKSNLNHIHQTLDLALVNDINILKNESSKDQLCPDLSHAQASHILALSAEKAKDRKKASSNPHEIFCETDKVYFHHFSKLHKNVDQHEPSVLLTCCRHSNSDLHQDDTSSKEKNNRLETNDKSNNQNDFNSKQILNLVSNIDVIGGNETRHHIFSEYSFM